MVDLPTPPAADAARLLPPGGELEARTPGASPEVTAAWHGVVWARSGRGDLAWAWWEHVDETGPLGPWLAAERARVLRDLGLHRRAQELDRAGLERASDLVDVVRLRLSLAADAAGLGDAVVARSRLDGATDLLRELPDGPRVARQRLRRSWVAVAVAEVEGSPVPTAGLPDVSSEGDVTHPADSEHGTDLHRARGLLAAARARRRPELLAPAAAIAPGALRWVVELARADTGDTAAPARAVRAWEAVVPPPGHEQEAARTPSARRLASLRARPD